jgi:hypothetical protein
MFGCCGEDGYPLRTQTRRKHAIALESFKKSKIDGDPLIRHLRGNIHLNHHTMSDDDAVMEEVPEHREKIIKPTKPDTLPWVEKYRPKDFSELIAHGDIISTRMSHSSMSSQ